ncbi:hypothetical protein NliqN6_3735 [Naganishia liquefaciens]|uniref:RTA1-domain-containing protein n=1 Tax=Naganishia liquefaciens TaxID=104408 RepID=A0A8H3TUW0_9TREE|nr:hypothetical protein NliqN6_3735 [Naganishia liquefaciens]
MGGTRNAFASKAAMAIVLFGAVGAHAARRNRAYCPEDPFLDPENDQCNPLRYIPVLWGAILALTLYFLVSILLTIQFFRHGGKYFLCLVIGAYCEGIGLTMRIPFRSNPHSTGIYIVEYLFVVLSPCAFLAADYILLGRITRHLNGHAHLKPINPNKIMRIFVGSDICTFLIQAAGGGLSTAQDNKLRDVGSKIFLAGIALQLVSFAFFTGVYLMFAWRVYKHDAVIWNHRGWKALYLALGWTCIMFLIRSVYRTIELSEGYTGYLNTHEPYFYFLDTLPLWLGISVYVWFWPTKYLREDNRILPPTEAEVAHEYAGAAPSVLPDAVPMDRSMSSTTSKEAANGAIEEKRLQS